VIHRDLAARNVLVGSSLENVKLADFGMSKSLDAKLYYRKVEREKVPVKWLAPECLQKKLFMHESDVWSYGVVVWEVFSHGATPYAGMTGLETAMAVGIGSRLLQPRDCPDEVYQLVLRMWSFDPEQRVSVAEIQDVLRRLLADFSTRYRGFASTAGDSPPTSPRRIQEVCSVASYAFIGGSSDNTRVCDDISGTLVMDGDYDCSQLKSLNLHGQDRQYAASALSAYSVNVTSPIDGKAAISDAPSHDTQSHMYQYDVIEYLKDRDICSYSNSNRLLPPTTALQALCPTHVVAPERATADIAAPAPLPLTAAKLKAGEQLCIAADDQIAIGTLQNPSIQQHMTIPMLTSVV